MKDLRPWIVTWANLAEFCGVSVSTLKRLRETGLPLYKPAGRVVGKPEEIEAWMKIRQISKRREGIHGFYGCSSGYRR